MPDFETLVISQYKLINVFNLNNKILIFASMLRFLFTGLLCLCISNSLHAQGKPIGQWRTHLPYENAFAITETGSDIFCATKGGLFSFGKADKELKTYSTIDGFADVNVAKIAANTNREEVIVAYTNTNIDLIKEGKIIRLPDIFNKATLFNKNINHITLQDNLAFFSCGFGIVVFDLDKREVKDTYFLGINGAPSQVFETAVATGNLLAATENGVYEISLSDPLPADVNRWKKHGLAQQFPGGVCKNIISFQDKIYALLNNQIYIYDGLTWKITTLFATDVTHIKSSNNQLISIAPFRVIIYNNSLQIVKNIDNQSVFSNAVDAIITNEQEVFIADEFKGLLINDAQNSFSSALPNGPATNAVYRLTSVKENIVLSAGGIKADYAPAFSANGFSLFNKENWLNYNKANFTDFNQVADIVNASYDNAAQSFYLSSYANGVVVFKDAKVQRIYNAANSSLQNTIGDAATCRVSATSFDADGNLWVSQYGVEKPLSVKNLAGQWQAFGFEDVVDAPVLTTDLLIDKANNKWMILRNEGLLIFNNGKYRKLTTAVNSGRLPSSKINKMALDANGQVWLATDNGPAVFEQPELILNGNVNATIPQITEGNVIKNLLNGEIITSVVVDAANRKWLGTNKGAWLFNATGAKQVFYFNTLNSPILSDKIIDITIDNTNGEVFFGTDKGIITYKSNATIVADNLKKVVVYPNPVRPDYKGTIGIKGLTKDCRIKITDIAGNLVYETVGRGGQATWEGKNLDGKEVASGVYLVLIINDDASETAVNKILIVR